MCTQSLQSRPSLCNTTDCSSPGSSVHGISQAISFSRGSSWPRDWTCVSCIAGRFFTTESLVNYPKTLIKPSTKKRECMFVDEHRCFHAQECWPLLSSGTGVASRLAHVGRCPVEGDMAGNCPQRVRTDNHQGPSPGLCKTVVCSLLDRPLWILLRMPWCFWQPVQAIHFSKISKLMWRALLNVLLCIVHSCWLCPK